MKGYLVKRAMKSGRNWKTMYFVLNDDMHTLCYYKKESDFKKDPASNIRGGITISGDTTVRQSSIHQNAIEVKTPNVLLYAYASTGEEQLLWVKAIQTLIDSLKGKSGGSSNNSNSNNSNNNNAISGHMTMMIIIVIMIIYSKTLARYCNDNDMTISTAPS